jgi:hypothetical protein
MNAAAGLDAGLLVGGEHEIAGGNPVTGNPVTDGAIR